MNTGIIDGIALNALILPGDYNHEALPIDLDAILPAKWITRLEQYPHTGRIYSTSNSMTRLSAQMSIPLNLAFHL